MLQPLFRDAAVTDILGALRWGGVGSQGRGLLMSFFAVAKGLPGCLQEQGSGIL